MLEHYNQKHEADSTVERNQIDEKDESVTYTGMVLAASILSNPLMIDAIQGKYTIVYDQALASLKFDNLNMAINIMAEKGWRCVGITSYNMAGQIFSQAIYMYALMERL